MNIARSTNLHTMEEIEQEIERLRKFSLTAIESLKPSVLAALMISGGWLAAYAMIYNELRRTEGR